MKLHSLRIRLLLASLLSVSLALLLAGWGLIDLFSAHVERRLDQELAGHLQQLTGGIEIDQSQHIQQRIKLADPRFSQPYSGLYWQIQDDSHATLLRSRSLWDQTLALPADELLPGDPHRHQLPGPEGQRLLIREQQVILYSHGQPHRLRIAVALDRAEILRASRDFSADIWPYLLWLAGFLMLASALQVSIGLAPMKRVRNGIAQVRSGRWSRLEGRFPEEIEPLVEEINELLEASEAAISRARSWTGDLAHGLKTPLTALSADIQRLRSQGQAAIADELEPLVESMRTRLDRELVRARLQSRTRAVGHRCQEQADLAKALNGVQTALARSPEGRRLAWHRELPEQLPPVAMHPSDLTELLGNLLDNACKWATTQILVTLDRQAGQRLCIEDDGPGVPEPELVLLGQRGIRLDENIAGHGLGLAIVRDICDAYGIEVDYSSSRLGGLRVCLLLPLEVEASHKQ